MLARSSEGGLYPGVDLPVAAAAAGVYTHVHYWFLLFGFGVAMVRRRQQIPMRASLLALGAIALLFLPDLPNLLRFQREAASAPHLRAIDLPSALPKLLAAIFVGFDYLDLPHLGIDRAIRASIIESNAALCALAALPAAMVGWQLVRLHRSRAMGPMSWLAHELFTVPVLASFLAVLVLKRDFIHPKYMIFSAPFLLLALTAGYLGIRGPAGRAIAGLASLAVFCISIVHLNEPREYGRREDWRGAAAFLRSHLDGESTLLWLGDSRRMTVDRPPQSLWEYYGSDLVPYTSPIALPRPDASPDDLAPVVARATYGKRRVYYLWSEILANREDPRDALIATARKTFASEQRIQFNPRLVLYAWSAP